MSNINFDNPWLLLIAVPLVIVLAIPFFIAVRKDNRNVHNVLSCILHVAIAVCISLSAAGMKYKSFIKETDVYVVADVSYSTNKNLDVVDGYIHNLRENLPIDTKLGVVCFGGNDTQVVHTPLGGKLRSVKEAVDKVDYSATDIVSALKYTGKIFKEGVVKRIVLITDAKQSDESDANALKRTVDELYAAEIYVDAIYLDSNISKEAKEVQISSVEVADKVYQGQSVQANVTIESSVHTHATLNLTKDGALIRSETIEVDVGTHNIPVSLDTTETGKFSYSVNVVEAEEDESPFNNVCTFTQTVSDKPVTLFVTDSYADEQQLQSLYGVNYADTVTVKYVSDPSANIPYTVAELCQYDEIVLSNVDVAKIRNYEMMIESLDTVVSLLGKSLVGLGNLGLQNTTDEALLRLADMLPVRYGSPISAQKLFVLVIDVSNSMWLNSRIHLAKQAAKQIVDLLDDSDMVSIVTFHGSAKVTQAPTKAINREDVKKIIDGLEGYHGTVISGGITGARDALSAYAETMQTQIFLLTDGASNNWASDNAIMRDVVKEMYQTNGIVTSVLGINVTGENATANRNNLKNLVNTTYGNGNYWDVTDGTTLTDEVLVEITNDFGNVIVDDLTSVKTEKIYDDVVENVEIPSTSYVGGYVASSAKANATTVLSAQHLRNDGGASVTVPIYSYWKYGNGKTASFLSSFSGTWMEKWHADGVDEPFFKNVFTVNVPAERVDAPFTATLSRQSGGASMEIRPAILKAGATVDVKLLTPTGESTEITNLVFDSNVYSCSFALPSLGEYAAEITYTYKGDSYTLVKPIHVSYLSEYDCFTAFDASPLYKMLGEKGTVSEDGNLEIVNDENEVGVRIVDLTTPLMIASVAMFAVDIIVRKIKWADIVGPFRRKRRRVR